MAEFRFGNYEFSRRQKNYTTALAFLAIGLGLGALAAFLVTPKTGKQVRKEVRRRYEDAREGVRDCGERAGDIGERREEWEAAPRRKVEPVARVFRKG